MLIIGSARENLFPGKPLINDFHNRLGFERWDLSADFKLCEEVKQLPAESRANKAGERFTLQ
jgi:hypothetical protein